MRPPATPEEQQRRSTARLVLHSAPVALLFGAVAASAVFGLARAAGASMLVPIDPGDPGSALVAFGLPMVLVQSIVPAFAAAIALSLLTRTSRPLLWFAIVVASFVAFTAGALLFPRTPAIARVDGGTRAALAAIHVARTAAIAWALVRASKARRPAPAGAR